MRVKSRDKIKPVPLVPTFAAKHELARYIHPIYRKTGGRVSSGAFLRNPGETYLSVNSVETESLDRIAAYYGAHLQQGAGNVVAACHKVFGFNSSASIAGVRVTRQVKTGEWVFLHNGANIPAYRHRPTPISASHCGVEFVIAFTDLLVEKKFARRMASAAQAHLFKWRNLARRGYCSSQRGSCVS